MNYYEELGLTPSASAEQIRQAYLNLVRLLHPDHQQSEELRRVADCQMKRLNHVNSVLSDPDRRRRYDHDRYRDEQRQTPVIVTAPPPPRSRVPGMLIWLGCAAATLGGITWWISRDAVVAIPATQASVSQAPQKQEPVRPVAEPAPAAVVSPADNAGKKARARSELLDLRLQVKNAVAERDRALLLLARQKAELDNLAIQLTRERERNRRLPQMVSDPGANPAR
jgi:hypothetical protein